MTDLMLFKRQPKVSSILALFLGLFVLLTSQAQAEVSTTVKDENGWRLQVDGEDFYSKGVVWGYTPRNQNFTYNLWGESDEFIRKVLDYDFGLMAKAGVNSNRSFAMIPPKWVTYIYREHGIRSVINPLMGRYGYLIDGVWKPRTDYSDPRTREVLIRDTLAIFETYKNVEGVYMFALGNESNYGLEWASFEIENLPSGDQHAAKARYLYSLYEEIISAGKKIAPNKLFSIVNGDIQYIDLIRELTPSLDVLGSNVYRGQSFTALWKDVDEKLDLPVVFYEFGSDAYNARESREDQLSQAIVLKNQWQEMYNKAWGNGEEGNSIGGFIFEWRDEWWKSPPFEENLDIHDNNATWSNQAYPFDWAEGLNNMNEEWFGITALGDANRDGVYTARPRMAYDVMQQIWSIDPYNWKKVAINDTIDGLNMGLYEVQGDVRMLKEESLEKQKILQFTGGSLRGEYLVKGAEQDLEERGENGLVFSNGEMAFLDFGFKPASNIDGQFSINLLGDVTDKEPLEIAYGRRGFPLSLITENDDPDVIVLDPSADLVDNERIEIYDFSATYETENFDVEAFYHTPRFHWGYKGDFYGLLWEATDLEGMDIWNSKAPEGMEIVGKRGWMKGLNILFGPEVYWGANPKLMVKYSNRIGKYDYTIVGAEDIARRDEGSGSTQATSRQTRQLTAYLKRDFSDSLKLELGGIMASTEKVDDTFTRLNYDTGQVFTDKIDFQDTLGIKAKLSFPSKLPLLSGLAYVAVDHAGLVADGGNPLRELGSRLPTTGLGAKREYTAGLLKVAGNWWINPQILYREALVDPNLNLDSSIAGGVLNPGLTARNREDDPFAILGNRDTRAGELIITYDPTGATGFYQWDNDLREDARLAFNLGFNYTEYLTPSDSEQFFFEPLAINAAFGVGLPAEDVYSVHSRIVFNPNNNARYIARLQAGYEQSTGDPTGGTRRYYSVHGKAVLGKRHIIEGYVKKDAWGPYDFHRQFNVTYPEQYKLDYSILLDSKLDAGKSTKIGVKTLYRTFDENSPDGLLEGRDGTNDYSFQTLFYFTYNFGGTPPPAPRD